MRPNETRRLLLVFSILASCTTPPDAPPDAGSPARVLASITGRVIVSGTPAPLAAVELTSARRIVHSGADGTFAVAGLPAGSYALRLRDASGRTAAITAVVARDGAGSVLDVSLGDVSLVAAGRLSGKVIRAGQPVVDALVVVEGVASAVATSAGYDFPALPAGPHALFVSGPDGRLLRGPTVTIVADQPTQQDLDLGGLTPATAGTIRGSVHRRAPGDVVELKIVGEGVAETVEVGADGNFASPLAAGIYSVRVRGAEQRTVVLPLVVVDGDRRLPDVILSPLTEACSDDTSPDADLDGVPDATEPEACRCWGASGADQDGDAICDAADLDADGDGVSVRIDRCPLFPDPAQPDLDGDRVGDGCDPDRDGDGALDASDNCPGVDNDGQADLDNDDLGDACDSDADGDDIPDARPDNCLLLANTDQANLDNDAFGDACDPDADEDGVLDATPDNCLLLSNTDQANLDHDAFGDACDTDVDGDTIPDALPDNCPRIANTAQGDGDHDLVGDACDNCPAVANADQADADHDGTGDACAGPPVTRLAQWNVVNPKPTPELASQLDVRDGKLWFVGESTLYERVGDGWVTHAYNTVNTDPPYPTELEIVSANERWVVDDSAGLFHFVNGGWTREHLSPLEWVTRAWSDPVSRKAFFVGTTGTAWRWTGTTIVEESTGTTDDLVAVAGRNDTDVWAGGAQTVVHWDGSTWSPVTDVPFNTADSNEELLAMAYVGDSLWIAAQARSPIQGTAVMRQKAGVWTRTVFPEYRTAWTMAIDGTSASDVWVAGAYITYHFDGTAWASHAAAADVTGLADVASLGTGSAWLLSDRGRHFEWDGVGWQDPDGAPWWQYGEAIYMAAADDVWFAPFDGGHVIHWDGTQVRKWSLGVAGGILGLDGTGPNDVWIGGYDDNAGFTLWHWEGVKWTRVTPTSLASSTSVNGIWAASTNEVFVAGNRNIFRLLNGTWSVSNISASNLKPFNDIGGTGPSDVWATTGDGAYRFDGNTWALVTFGTKLTGVMPFADGHVYLVERGGTVKHRSTPTDPFVTETLPGAGGLFRDLQAIWGAASNDVWASDRLGGLYRTTGDGTWTRFPTYEMGAGYAFAGTSASNIWNYGDSVRRFDGTSWKTLGLPGSPRGNLYSAWVAPDNSSGLTVGKRGLVLRWDGSTWSETHAVASSTDAYDVSGVAPDDLWIVGSGGRISHYDGVGGRDVASSKTVLLNAVSMRSAGDGWIVGQGGTILRWNGASWATEKTGTATTATLNAVCAEASGEAWAVGAAALVLHWTGSTWETIPPPTGVTSVLYSVGCSATAGAWVGESSGRVWVRQAGAWTARHLPATKLVGRIRVLPDGRVLASALQAAFLWDGGAWTDLQYPLGNITDLAMLSSGKILSFGWNGAILERQ